MWLINPDPVECLLYFTIKYSWPLSFYSLSVSRNDAGPGPDTKSVLERNVEMWRWCWKCWMWSELERERWCWKSRNEESWLAPSCTLDNYSTKPLRPQQQPLIILISSFWQFLPVLAEKKQMMKRIFGNSHENHGFWTFMHHDIDLGGSMVGEDPFLPDGWELCLNSHKKRCNYLGLGWSLGAQSPARGRILARHSLG